MIAPQPATHICVFASSGNDCSASDHYLSQCLLIVKLIPVQKRRSFNRNWDEIETALKNMHWKISFEKYMPFVSLYHSMAVVPRASCQIRKIVGCACAGLPGTLSPPSRVKRSRHASRHVHDARAVMLAGIARKRFHCSREIVPGIPSVCATRNFTYLVRGPWTNSDLSIVTDELGIKSMYRRMWGKPNVGFNLY